MSPTLVFDKSFLQSLTVDESAMLDQMFSCVVTPVFMVETLADLSKAARDGRHPDAEVARIAEKTPVARSYMNTFHPAVAASDLLGRCATMDHRPAIAGGVPVRVDGRPGVVFEQSPEAEAFERWQDGDFHDVERRFAAAWRESLGELNLKALADGYRSIIRRESRPKSHADARGLAAAIVNAPGQSFRSLRTAHALLDLKPDEARRSVVAWRAAGSLPLRHYAPFAAHCLEVDLYFALAMTNGIISDQRASNRVDVAYICYTPFARVFASSDKLHRSAAPLFLDPDQQFVWGPDLKADLARLNGLFSALPDEERAKGLFLLASTPPIDDDGLCARLWDAASPDWRKPRPPLPEFTKEQHDAIVGRSNRSFAAARAGMRSAPPLDERDIEHVVMRRHIPKIRGSWRMFSAEAEASSDEEWRRELGKA